MTVDMNPDYLSSFITVGMVGQVDTIHVTVSTFPSASVTVALGQVDTVTSSPKVRNTRVRERISIY